MATTRTQRAYRRNVQGNATPYIAGLTNARLTALDNLEWQAFTEVSGLNIEKTDNTTITMPNDDDGFNLVEITTGYGSLQEQTATLTEYMDERQNTSWIAGVKRDLPGSLWLPQGRGRQRSDKDDFTSGTLIDLFRLQSDNQDDNANPSEGDVGNPNKISVGISYHGRNRHTIRPASFTEPSVETAIGHPVTGVVSVQKREDTGAISRVWFILEQGDSDEKPQIHKRDEFGQWLSAVPFGANNDKANKLAVMGGYLITLTQEGHVAILQDDLTNATDVVNTEFTEDSSASIPNDIYVVSANQAFIAAGTSGAAGHAKLLEIDGGPLDSSLILKSENTAAGTGWNAIDGFGSQIVVGGHTGGASTVGALLVSEDSGETFSSLTAPSGSKGISAVRIVDVDTFWVGTDDGKLWWTYNFGKTWTSVTPGITMTAINDIQFLWPQGAEQASRVGYLAGTSGSTKTHEILRTIDGGATWSQRKSYIAQEVQPTAHASNKWWQLAVADAQSVVAAGSSGASSGVIAMVELE